MAGISDFTFCGNFLAATANQRKPPANHSAAVTIA
jgi:hypothetical protein